MQALIPEIGLALIAVALGAVLVLIWTKLRLDTPARIARTVTSILWSGFYAGIELVLAASASAGVAPETLPSFVLATGGVCVAALSALAFRVRPLLSQLLAEQRVRIKPGCAPTGDRRCACDLHAHSLRRSARVRGLVVWVLAVVALIAVSLLCFVFLEAPSNPAFMALADPYLVCEMSVIGGAVVGSWLIFQRRPLGLILPMAVSLGYGMAEYFVEAFKSSAITPSDLRSFQTGLRVAVGYEYEMTTMLLLLIALFTMVAAVLVWLPDPLTSFLRDRCGQRAADQRANPWRKRVALLNDAGVVCASLCVGAALVALPVSKALARDWEEEGVSFEYWDLHLSVDEYGLIPSFMAALQFEDIEPPEGYRAPKAEELQGGLANFYDQRIGATSERQAAMVQFDEARPNVIMVMNETFSDLSYLDGLGVGYGGPQEFTDMGAIARGQATVGVLGGGTCNSEFEALTGISLGYVGGGYIPYALCDLSNVDTLPKQFKALGYDTVALHPELATNWSRDKVYPAMGFDEFIDVDGFEGAERVRDRVRDSEVYDRAVERIVESDTPQFIFGLTMMGHGGYDSGLIPEEENVDYDFAGLLDEDLAAEANEYLSSIRMSDRDLQRLIHQLKELDEPTVIVFFGDHQPGIAMDLQEALHDTSDEIAHWEELYQTDYLIWANYDVAGSPWTGHSCEVLYTGTMPSANLLGWAMSFIGAPLTAFDKASYMSREWVQSNNIFGYLDGAGVWHPMSEAEQAAGSATFTEGMEIIEACMERGLLLAEFLPEDEVRQHQDAVMVNVMKWITYLNFAEALG